MKFITTEIKTLKELLFLLKNSKFDPTTFFRFFGHRSFAHISILDPKVLLSSLRKNLRFLQKLIFKKPSVNIILFVCMDNKFLWRQLALLRLKTSNISIVDIRKVNIHEIFKKMKGSFCCISLFLTSDLDKQLAEQAYKRCIPVIFFKAPITNELKGEGSIVSNINTYIAESFIIHFLCVGLAQISHKN